MADTEASEVHDRKKEVSVRKVVASEFVSLDGVMEDPSWAFRFTGKEQQKFKFDELSASDALLLGRVTYESFAAAWPRMTEQAGELSVSDALLLGRYADMMNGYPKYVASTTLQEPLEWNNSTLIEGDIAEEVSRLKRQPGKDILIFGSGKLVNTLMRHDLIDEYRLMIFPIIVGSGQRLFADGIDEMVLELVDTETFGSGVVVLTYRAAAEQDS
jgi:dihydrofolate reductase